MTINDNKTNLQATKPLLRGHLHQAFFFFSLGASIMLYMHLYQHQYALKLFIYLLSLNSLYLISTLYHRPNWNEVKRMIMRRLDHSAIFFLIAGTATPIIALKLPDNINTDLQIANWTIALLGVAVSLIWVKAPKIFNFFIYILAGCFWLIFLRQFYLTMNAFELSTLILGGIFYIFGAVFYATKKPNFIKNVFGYHELFHLFVILGSIAHFSLITYIYLN